MNKNDWPEPSEPDHIVIGEELGEDVLLSVSIVIVLIFVVLLLWEVCG